MIQIVCTLGQTQTFCFMWTVICKGRIKKATECISLNIHVDVWKPYGIMSSVFHDTRIVSILFRPNLCIELQRHVDSGCQRP